MADVDTQVGLDALTDLSDQVQAMQDTLNALVIAQAQGSLIHKRNTYVFNAASGAVAATPTQVVFFITGRVFVDLLTAYTFATLTSGGTPAITCGTLTDVDSFMVAPTGGATDLATGDWWTSAASVNHTVGPVVVVTGQAVTSQRFKLLDENIGLAIPVAAVTGGVLIFDVWYLPITDDGALTPRFT